MIEIIFYVSDQERSKIFYEKLLGREPFSDVPGMTEFSLGEGIKFGIMPENGIAKIICPAAPHPSQGNGIPRSELYMLVDDVEKSLQLALNAGAKLISTPTDRDWGDYVAYSMDPDGHILAFAKKKAKEL